VICWQRAGFRLYWRWKSRRRCGRPTVPLEIRLLIRQMSIANPLWGAPRIHGELLRLGIDVGQTSVAKWAVSIINMPGFDLQRHLVGTSMSGPSFSRLGAGASPMPRYHFDLVDSKTVAHERGQELPDDAMPKR
jgi:hypothetical protein